jgi:hypothetical protein
MLVRGAGGYDPANVAGRVVALVSGGQHLRDDWIRVELAGVEDAIERTAGSPALDPAAHWWR